MAHAYFKNNTAATDLNESPIEALAAWVYYNPEGSSRLNGDVKISQQGRLILADNAELSHDKSSGQFTGNILLAEAGYCDYRKKSAS
jgi:LPS-assembly protein